MKPAKLERDWKKKVGNRPVDVWDRLSEIERETLITRPPGSFTVREYAIKRCITYQCAKATLYRLHALGKLTRHKVPGSSGVYYTLKT